MTGFMLAVLAMGRQRIKKHGYNIIAQDKQSSWSGDAELDALMQAADLNATIQYKCESRACNSILFDSLCLLQPCDVELSLADGFLHLIMMHQIPDMIPIILKKAQASNKNVNVNLANKNGDTALHYVVKIDGIDKPKGLEFSALRKQAVDDLVAYGANIAVSNKQGDTILHVAARHNDSELLFHCIDKYPIDTNIKNQNGDTWLHVAVKHKLDKLIEQALAKYGPGSKLTDNKKMLNLSIANNQGKTPLQLAVESDSNIAKIIKKSTTR
jgi:hypothetical protein